MTSRIAEVLGIAVLLTVGACGGSNSVESASDQDAPGRATTTEVQEVLSSTSSSQPDDLSAPLWCLEYEEWQTLDSATASAASLSFERQIAWKQEWLAQTIDLSNELSSAGETDLKLIVHDLIELSGPAETGLIDDPEDAASGLAINEARLK